MIEVEVKFALSSDARVLLQAKLDALLVRTARPS